MINPEVGLNPSPGSFKFFDSWGKYCINHPRRSDRWAAAVGEFSRVGLQVERFLCKRDRSPHLSFNLTQKMLLEKLEKEGRDSIIFEDDVSFHGVDISGVLDLPSDWDIVYLGCNLKEKPEYFTQRLRRVKHAWTTHAIGYSKKVVPFINERFVADCGMMYDDFLCTWILPQVKAYVINPMISCQRPDFSDIWSQPVDYTFCFEQGNKMME